MTNLLKQIAKSLKEVEDQINHLQSMANKLEIQQNYQDLLGCTQYLSEQISYQNENQFIPLYNMFRFHSANFSQVKQVIKLRNEISGEMATRKDNKQELF